MTKGLTIVYIGDGKGKTSAAVGLATRALGTGFKVAFYQFVKGDWPSGERAKLAEMGAEVKLLGRGFVGILGDRKPLDEHRFAAEDALDIAMKALTSKKFQLVILDEVISAVEIGLLEVKDVLDLIAIKPHEVHLCMTGHKRYKKIIEVADLVTEMKMIKHPYYEGILAQRGIDY